jgi:hypothetical protein
MTSTIVTNKVKDTQPPLDNTRPFMDDKRLSISVTHAPLAGRTRNG